MDELELLKKSWKQQEQHLPQIDKDELVRMTHHRSTSTVKWIMIIAIIEFLFWISLTISMRILDANHGNKAFDIATYDWIRYFEWINIACHLTFIYLFVRNYRLIETQSSTKQLMQNILRTRKTVNVYVAYNLIGAGIGFAFGLYHSLSKMDVKATQPITDNPMTLVIVTVLAIVCLLLFIGLIWGFYRIIYGILLRRLKRNYEELKKNE